MTISLLQIVQQNIAAAAAYTEYSITVPPAVFDLTLALRPSGTPANIFWYTAPSGSAHPGSSANLPAVYGTIPANGSRWIPGKRGGQIIYFQVDQTNQVLETDYYGDQ
jgi:hypothetical protein